MSQTTRLIPGMRGPLGAVITPEVLENTRQGLQGALRFFQGLAAVIGYPLASIGWLGFSIGLAAALPTRLDPFDAHFLRVCGDAIVPGWLLLRFAAGLFPFGLRLFRA